MFRKITNYNLNNYKILCENVKFQNSYKIGNIRTIQHAYNTDTRMIMKCND